MVKNRFCPLPSVGKCTSECGFYSKLDKRCSINLLAEALIAIVDVRGKVFTSIVTSSGRTTIPFAIRKELNLGDGDLIKVLIAKEIS